MDSHQQRIPGGEFAQVAAAVQHPLEALYEEDKLTYFCS
jgi:hypothetical protein